MKNKNDLIWYSSLLIIGIATIIFAGSRIMGTGLSDIVVRIIGIIDLVMLPFLGYTTVKKFKKDK